MILREWLPDFAPLPSLLDWVKVCQARLAHRLHWSPDLLFVTNHADCKMSPGLFVFSMGRPEYVSPKISRFGMQNLYDSPPTRPIDFNSTCSVLGLGRLGWLWPRVPLKCDPADYTPRAVAAGSAMAIPCTTFGQISHVSYSFKYRIVTLCTLLLTLI